MKNLIVVAILVCCCAGFAQAQDQTGRRQSTPAAGPEALWQPGMQAMQTIREACASTTNFGDCFASQMQKFGASPEAVAFTKLTDNTGYLRDFREAGAVDVAYVNYPFRANENQGCLLVNGNPRVIDVDDINALPQDEMRKDAIYSALAGKYPNVAVFPGDRSGTNYPAAEKLPGGGRRFVVTYRLVDGCHACARLGAVKFAFDFDRAGVLTGKKFLTAERSRAATATDE